MASGSANSTTQFLVNSSSCGIIFVAPTAEASGGALLQTAVGSSEPGRDESMWTIEHVKHGDVILSDGKIEMRLTVDEAIELTASLDCLRKNSTFHEFQQAVDLLFGDKPATLRGDLITIDPENPSVFVLRTFGRMPDADHWRKAEYRIGKQEAEDLSDALHGGIEDADDYA